MINRFDNRMTWIAADHSAFRSLAYGYGLNPILFSVECVQDCATGQVTKATSSLLSRLATGRLPRANLLWVDLLWACPACQT